MGIFVEQWRVRIGSFGRNGNDTMSANVDVHLSTLLMFLSAAAVVSYLLIIGGVEVNPGPFPCNLCSTIPETIASSVRHQQMHAVNRNFEFSCPVKDCKFFTTSYGSPNFHVSKFHRTTRHQDPAATKKIICSIAIDAEGICSYSTTSMCEFVQHLCKHINANIPVSCPISGCLFSSMFLKTSTFRVHLSQYHKQWAAEGSSKKHYKVDAPVTVDNLASEDFDAAEKTIEDEYDTEQCFNFDENCDSELLNDELIYDTIANFYLNLYAIDLLPASLIQKISTDITFISDIVQGRVNLMVISALKKLGIEEEKIKALCLDVKLADPLYVTHHKNVPGPSLTSDYLRKEYFKYNFNYLPPVEVSLNEDDPTSDEKYMYISPTATLQVLLKDLSVQDQIDALFTVQQPEDGNILSDYKTGSQYLSENHPPREIQLFVYQDTVNAVTNALGSAKNKFKMMAMYFTIANYQPHIRAKVDTKYVALLMRESIFKKVGQKKCLERIVNEFKELETNGILYKNVEKIKVVVQYMLGDNLGQHTIGGFIESFSGKYFCRYCPTTKKDFRANPHLTEPPRTVEDYNECVRQAKLSQDGHHKGVNQDSEFNSLQYFHAVSHLVPDLAHDLFEEVISIDMAGIIAYFVGKKYFTYDQLNRRIRAFRCRSGDSPNKPAFVPTRKTMLGGHAVQNWTMLRLFPFIKGDLIQDYEDPGWLLYLKLKELSEYFCAPSLDKQDLPFIKDVLLPAYFETRAIVLTTKKYRIRPKHHFMTHLVELMLKHGAPLNLWTLSYEQRHKFFKQVMRMSKNYINPEYTCAVRYQLHFCYLNKSGPLFPKGCMEIKSKLKDQCDFPGEISELLEGLHLENDWRFSKGVVFDDLSYNTDDLLLLSSEEGSLKVGLIKAIATRRDSLFFVLEVATAQKNQVDGIYYLPSNCSGQYIWKSASELQHPVSQPFYVYNDKKAFSLKYKILDC